MAVVVDPFLNGFRGHVSWDRLACSEPVEKPKGFSKQSLAHNSFAEAHTAGQDGAMNTDQTS